MKLSYPSQRIQDWLSQHWCVFTGQRIVPEEVPWLMGPYGNVDVIEDRYVEALAESEGLEVRKNEQGFGLIDSFSSLKLDSDDLDRLNPSISDFYEHTLDYEFEVWFEWCQFFRPFGGLIVRLFSKRLQQLNLPLNPLDTAQGIKSQIFKLRNRETGENKYTIWYRHIKSSQEVIYSGVYGSCTLPDGTTCMKVVFPLPRGNATVLMRFEIEEDGALTLVSKGKRFGDPGFYFLLVDSKGRNWARYLPTLHESIRVYEDQESVLRADHLLNLWGTRALHLHYRINPVASRSMSADQFSRV